MMETFLQNSFWKPDIAIDLGVAMARVLSCKRNQYMVPSVVRGKAMFPGCMSSKKGKNEPDIESNSRKNNLQSHKFLFSRFPKNAEW